ncbi:MAG: hypothetical protein ACLR8P_21965 [Clostridium fessum]
MKVSGLYGEFGRVLAEAGAIADTPKMKEAVALYPACMRFWR